MKTLYKNGLELYSNEISNEASVEVQFDQKSKLDYVIITSDLGRLIFTGENCHDHEDILNNINLKLTELGYSIKVKGLLGRDKVTYSAMLRESTGGLLKYSLEPVSNYTPEILNKFCDKYINVFDSKDRNYKKDHLVCIYDPA